MLTHYRPVHLVPEPSHVTRSRLAPLRADWIGRDDERNDAPPRTVRPDVRRANDPRIHELTYGGAR